MNRDAAVAAVRANPVDAQAWFDLGEVLAAEGEIAKARECYEQAWELDEDLAPEVERALALLDVPAWFDQMSHSAPAASPASRRRGRGCLVGTLLTLGCIAAIAFTELAVYQSWFAGVAAFSAGECRSALPSFDVVMEQRRLGIIDALYAPRSNVALLREECLALLKGEEMAAAGDLDGALIAYLDFPAIYPGSSLRSRLPAQIAALFGQASVQELASEKVCDRVGLLGETELVPRPDEFLPEMYYYCGLTYQSVGELENAIAMYSIVWRDYARHPLNPEAMAALAEAEIDLAKRSGANTLNPPQQSGTAPLGTAVYIVRNDSPHRTRLVLRGPELIIEDIPECKTCVEFTTEPESCPAKGPVKRFTLKPGKYDVAVTSLTDDHVNPYHGSWPLLDGVEYSQCFFIIVTSESQKRTPATTSPSRGNGTQ